jgi:hypothetical protein
MFHAVFERQARRTFELVNEHPPVTRTLALRW